MNFRAILLALFSLLVGIIVSPSLRKGTSSASPTPIRSYAMNYIYSGWAGWLPVADMGKKMSEAIPGLRVSFGGPLDSEPSKQIEEIETLISQQVSGIVLFPSDPFALSRSVDKAVERGIPVVTMSGDAQGSKRLTHITPDERNSALRLVERVLTDTKENYAPSSKLKVLICTARVGVPNLDLRVLGVKDALSADPRMSIVGIVADEADDAKATELVSAAWERNQGLDYIIGVDARSAIGAIAALKEKRRKAGEVTIIGWDNDADTLQAIKDGWIHAVSMPNFAYMTQLALSILEAANRNYLHTDTLRLREFDLPALPPHIDIQQTYIDKTNVDGFFPRL